MTAKHFISQFVRKNFDETGSISITACTAVGGKGEFSNVMFRTCFPKLLLGLAAYGYFWVGINNSRDGSIIDVAGLACDDLRADYAFVFGLMSQHSAADDITDSINALDIRLEIFVYGDKTMAVDVNANLF